MAVDSQKGLQTRPGCAMHTRTFSRHFSAS